jgi:hypothetical protein
MPVPKFVNYSQRPFTIGSTLFTPHLPAEMPEGYEDHPRVQELMAEEVPGTDKKALAPFEEPPPPEGGARESGEHVARQEERRPESQQGRPAQHPAQHGQAQNKPRE